LNPGSTAVNVTKDTVRYVANTGISETVFGKPFGDVQRNSAQDAISNIFNFSVFKKVKFTERASFDFRLTMVNAFNHFNFASVDPFIEDAGLNLQGTGFATPSLTGANGRKITLVELSGSNRLVLGKPACSLAGFFAL